MWQIFRNGRLVAGQEIPKGTETLDDVLSGIVNDVMKMKEGDEVDNGNNNENENKKVNICPRELISVKGKQHWLFYSFFFFSFVCTLLKK